MEETLKRITAHKGVVGVLIVNAEGCLVLFWSGKSRSFLAYCYFGNIETGIPIRTTVDNSTTVQYAGLFHQLANKARSTVRDVDPQVSFNDKL